MSLVFHFLLFSYWLLEPWIKGREKILIEVFVVPRTSPQSPCAVRSIWGQLLWQLAKMIFRCSYFIVSTIWSSALFERITSNCPITKQHQNRSKTDETTPVIIISPVATRIGLSPLLNFAFGRKGSAAAFSCDFSLNQSRRSQRSNVRLLGLLSPINLAEVSSPS